MKNQTKHSLLCLLLFIYVWLPVRAQDGTPKHQSKTEIIKAVVEKYCQDHPFSGAVLVAQNRELVWKGAKGFANKATEQKNLINTKFLVGSVSKQFTAMIVLQLVQEGKLKLDDLAIKYFPFLPKEKSTITIHQLLSHTSGLGHYSKLNVNAKKFMYKPVTPIEYAKVIAKMGMVAKPGKKMSYSSMGYILLAAIAEQITGKTFSTLLEERIARPLGLKNTGFTLNTNELQNFALSYDLKNQKAATDNDFRFKLNKPRHQSNTYSTGGIHSTVEDMLVWFKALATNKLLNKELTKKMFTPNLGNYAYGWFINDVRLTKAYKLTNIISHGGSVNGFRAAVSMFNNQQDFVIILANHPSRIWLLTAEIKKALDRKE
ncbi:serine hydrolase [uncultured Microscilla sp.]|uniref:serine hydrolase domain-containing protein n=1 Tax=uncultured Microscilla sp. TaxID=432653 RepID=UPI002621BFED|nr:serine hydrolase domain-containing protein [uncultured Microscilla sp.]